MAAAGKEGRVYLIDRDNLGKYQAAADSVVSSVLISGYPVFGSSRISTVPPAS